MLERPSYVWPTTRLPSLSCIRNPVHLLSPDSSRVNIHSLRLSYAALSTPSHEIVNDARPGAVFAPKGERLVRHCLASKLECLVPHVAVNRPGPFLLEERRPEAEPIVLLGHPRPSWLGEEDAPVDYSIFEAERLLVHFLAGVKGVAIHFFEVCVVSPEGSDLRSKVRRVSLVRWLRPVTRVSVAILGKYKSSGPLP